MLLKQVITPTKSLKFHEYIFIIPSSLHLSKGVRIWQSLFYKFASFAYTANIVNALITAFDIYTCHCFLRVAITAKSCTSMFLPCLCLCAYNWNIRVLTEKSCTYSSEPNLKQNAALTAKKCTHSMATLISIIDCHVYCRYMW